MAPSTLDLLILTFNCAKNLIHPPSSPRTCSRRLGTTRRGCPTWSFCEKGRGLPRGRVLTGPRPRLARSLQEIAPLSQAFIGDYFLGPYFARFDEAVNLAATRHGGDGRASAPRGAEAASASSASSASAGDRRQYALVKAHNVGYTAVMLFARDASRLRELELAEVGFGAADMGNKGAVGLRALYRVGDGERSTELTFVATHLAAMEWNLPRRNANWAAIMRGLTFGNPEELLERAWSGEGTPKTPGSPGGDGDGDGESAAERRGLLHDEHDRRHAELRRWLHDMSIFKPSSHLFVAGDLNYRIATTPPPPDAALPSLDAGSEHRYPAFLALDQLTRERAARRTLHGLTEPEVRFPPTYKYVVDGGGDDDDDDEEIPARFAPRRWPSWTDRILYLDVPAWARRRGGGDGDGGVRVRAYDALPAVRTSDHRAVFLRADVPLVAPGDLVPPPLPLRGDDAADADPRLRLPVELDPEAWERRRAARRKERLVGWAVFLWSTREGAWVLATLVLAGLGGYWYYQAAA